MSIPTEHKVLAITSKQGPWKVSTVEVPKPEAGQLLVRVESTGLNPVDWKIHDYGLFITEYPAVIGSDGAGTVVEIGEGVSGFAVGDRVLFNGKRGKGTAAYQQYSIIDRPAIAVKIPPALSFDQAATIPSGVGTAIAALFGHQWGSAGSTPYAAPWEEGNRTKYAGEPIVIIGGSSSVGQYVIQFAKLSGFSPIITTASPRNFDLVKSLGATHVVDRSLDDAAILAEVKKITSKPIKLVLDSISESTTQPLAYDILSPGGTLVLTLPSVIDSKITPEKKAWQVVGGFHVPGNKALGESLAKELSKLLETGDIKPLPVAYASGGLSSIPTELDKLKAGKISGQKIIVRPGETA